MIGPGSDKKDNMGYLLSNEEKLSTWRDKWRKVVNVTRQMGLMWKHWWGLLWHKLSSVQTANHSNKQVPIKESQNNTAKDPNKGVPTKIYHLKNNTAWYSLVHLVASKSPMTHLGMLRRRKVRTMIDIILIVITSILMMLNIQIIILIMMVMVIMLIKKRWWRWSTSPCIRKCLGHNLARWTSVNS